MRTRGQENKEKAMAAAGPAKHVPNVYLYVPNLIGYARIILAFASYHFFFVDDKIWLASLCYFLSFCFDELDGRFARMLDQCSTFGAVLDMVTDRTATACLLLIVSHKWPQLLLLCMFVLTLDIGSHWFQMYSTLLCGRTGHKEISDDQIFILRWYYRYRPFFGYCCVSNEIFILVLAIYKHYAGPQIMPTPEFLSTCCPRQNVFALEIVMLACLPGFVSKQFINVVQLASSAALIVDHDLKKQK